MFAPAAEIKVHLFCAYIIALTLYLMVVEIEASKEPSSHSEGLWSSMKVGKSYTLFLNQIKYSEVGSLRFFYVAEEEMKYKYVC